ncbi:unnamed protein product [Pieris macdunnoughi]|uniref:Uncharacterized protein n=1 Tax=Pieris macdunnoughi TaxID=345717 RepID=A0A821MDJ7_9NEOP|nr:unnamed protein product [Pieris macdunnoughi]
MTLEAICLVELSLSHELNIDTMTFAFLLIIVIIGVFILCNLGQIVDNACTELEEAATEKWYDHDMKYKKSVLIFYTAVTQGMPIYIYGSVTLSLETFTWFIKTGMSFYTVVRSVLEN